MDNTQRIARVEVKLDGHDKSITSLTTSLTSLEKDFNQIKWMIAGGIAFFILNQFGLVELIKKLL